MNTPFDNELLAEVTNGCRKVWNDIAPDIGENTFDDCKDADEECYLIVECCLDADRLQYLGYPNEYAAMKLLLEQGTFNALCNAIANEW